MSSSGAGQSCFQDVPEIKERGQLMWIIGFVEGGGVSIRSSTIGWIGAGAVFLEFLGRNKFPVL